MKKVVLISTAGYSQEHDDLLISFLDQGYNLFCVVGKQCQHWEEVMDELAVGNGDNVRSITTTSHPQETVEEVLEFARSYSTKSEVEVVRV